MTCPSCSSDTTEGSRFCSNCGEAVSELSAQATRQRTPSGPPPRIAAPDSHFAHGRFSPGEVLSARYRIVERVGRGGMGEVYHADDLTLEQPVALKFLPEGLSLNEDLQRRFRREVRIARQIAHPNVCRVYDIGETNGLVFLTMEYIDGEDLGSLLRRIGRLPPDKAVEIARQLASGLAAAHDKGVLHRDLKPANVMLDDRGHARITDFGLATAAGNIEKEDIRSGTPGYMAPEQRAGLEVTEKSDLFSLGLVLYELFTGKRAFEAKTTEELARMQEETAPTRPSSVVVGMDPVVEGVILKCLEKNPQDRPPSALAVRAALPGGDPLDRAVAAGETPAPELVADAAEKGALRPAVAWTYLGSVFLGLLIMVWSAPINQMSRRVPLPSSPDVLVTRAQEILAEMGDAAGPGDDTYGFRFDRSYISFLDRQTPVATRFDPLGTADQGAIRFWYRWSPRYIVPYRLTEFFPTDFDPPLSAGMMQVELDTTGRLRRFDAVRPPSPVPPVPIDWAPLFEAAGLSPDSDALVDTATSNGRISRFTVIEPWSAEEDLDISIRGWTQTSNNLSISSGYGSFVHIGATALFILVGALLAWRNLRLGRGDQKSAFRLAVYFLALNLAHWFFAAHHVLDRFEVQLLYGGLYVAFFYFGLSWLFYMAFEPFVRRLWPRMLVSWIRLMEGRFHDPLVGRHILIGCVLAVTFQIESRTLFNTLPQMLGNPSKRPDAWGLAWMEVISLNGIRHSLAQLFHAHSNVLITVMFFMIGFLVLRFVLRSDRATFLAAWLLLSFIYYARSGGLVGFLFALTFFALMLGVLIRVGWLAVFVAQFLHDVMNGWPLTFDLSAWYAHSTIIALLVVGGLAIYGFKVSLGGKPAFQNLLGEERLAT